MTLDWAETRLAPFAHQREDAESVVQHPFLFIASEMRTGKTKIVIDGAQFLFKLGLIDRVIVLAPEPVRSVWCHPQFGELQKHLWLTVPSLITEFHSELTQWHFGPDVPQKLRWVVTNYEFLRPFKRKNSPVKNDENVRTLLKYCNAKTLLVLDESGAITNHKSESFDACFKLRQKCGRVILMNGTPFDTPIHLFAQGNMLHSSILECKFITHFKERYAEQKAVTGRNGKELLTSYGATIKTITGWKNLEDLQRRFAPYTIRRLQKDCLDLPPKLPAITLTAKMTTSWPVYKEMRDEMVVMLESGNASVAQQAITKFMRLSQITGGYLGGVEDAGMFEYCHKCQGAGCGECFGGVVEQAAKLESVREVGREKLDVLLYLVGAQLEKDHNLKIVVWARFKHELDRMLKEVKAKFPQMIVAALRGGQKKDEREYTKSLLKPETAPSGPVFVGGTLGTGSFGLDFSASHTSVNYSYDHSLRKFLQSGDRVYGPSQVSPIDYFDIVAVGPKGQKTYDAVIVQARRTKQDLATWTTDAWVKALTED